VSIRQEDKLGDSLNLLAMSNLFNFDFLTFGLDISMGRSSISKYRFDSLSELGSPTLEATCVAESTEPGSQCVRMDKTELLDIDAKSVNQ